jgi:AcrR family transcriptional regulator
MGRLADALDVAAGGLYRYFPSKDALVAAVQIRTVARMEEALRSRLAKLERELPDDAIEAALAAIVGAVLAYRGLERREPESLRLVSAGLARPEALVADPEARAAVPAVLSLLGLFADRFARAAEVGALEPGDGLERTVSLWAAVHGAQLLGKLARLDPEGRSSFAPDALALSLTTTLLRGWGADPQHLDAARARAEETARP